MKCGNVVQNLHRVHTCSRHDARRHARQPRPSEVIRLPQVSSAISVQRVVRTDTPRRLAHSTPGPVGSLSFVRRSNYINTLCPPRHGIRSPGRVDRQLMEFWDSFGGRPARDTAADGWNKGPASASARDAMKRNRSVPVVTSTDRSVLLDVLLYPYRYSLQRRSHLHNHIGQQRIRTAHALRT